MKTINGREIETRLVNSEGEVVRPLPHAQVQNMSWTLNSYGQMNFAQSTHSPGAGAAAQLRLNEVQVWVEGSLDWWGVPMTESGGPGQQQIGCDGLGCYFEERIVDDRTLEYSSVDQFAIASALVQYAQSEEFQANRDRNIGVSIPAPSGKVRTERYLRNDHKTILELLIAFTQLEDGFDFDILFTEDGQRLWTPYYPQKGQFRPELMLEYGKNIAGYTINRSAVNMRTQTYCAGGAAPNTEEGRIEQVYEDIAASELYGVIQKVISDGSQMDPGWLLERATEDVIMGNHISLLPEITAVDLEDAELYGVISPGDTLPVRIVDGEREVEGNFRISTITWNNNETLSLQFISEEAA